MTKIEKSQKFMLYILLSKALFLIYDLIFLSGFLIYLLIGVWRQKINIVALREKLGFISDLKDKNFIWIQAVSVGEVNLLENLIKKLKEVYNYPILISTTTSTGNKIARKKYSSLATIIFFPLDISLVIFRALKKLHPKIFIAIETEIWPNLFCCLKRRNIPIIIINGRISDQAFRRYRLIRPIIGKAINNCSYIGVQNIHYRQRFLYLGAQKEKVVVSGNMKFESIAVDEVSLSRIKQTYAPIIKKDGELLLIAASTHFPEEEVIIRIYKNIISDPSKVNLLIAPRHPERTASIDKLIRQEGFNPVRTSEILKGHTKDTTNIFILDTVGELFYFYSLADICFVGGSLFTGGGQNILEPIYFLKPTVFGPAMSNFRDIEEIVLEKGAGIKVNTPRELGEILVRLSKDEALRVNLGNKCLGVFEAERKSLENNLKLVLSCLT